MLAALKGNAQAMSAAAMPSTRREPPAVTEPSDEHYVKRAARGDRGAFECLYRRHSGRIYALCLRMTANRALAEDTTQDAFIQAWRKLSAFRGDAAFTSWLHRIAVNVVLSQQRKHSREQAGLHAAADEALLTQAEEPRRDGEELEAAIADLPTRARHVFVLVGVCGYSHEEAGEALGIAAGTCKAQLHRARQLLADRLQGEHNE
jgi:RNA polymerase sigma-70 factor (ECF subfamily)